MHMYLGVVKQLCSYASGTDTVIDSGMPHTWRHSRRLGLTVALRNLAV